MGDIVDISSKGTIEFYAFRDYKLLRLQKKQELVKLL